MSLVPIFRGRVEAGKIFLNDREGFAAQRAKLEGQEIEVILRGYRQRRSDSQNAYYWGVVLPLLGEYCGYEVQEIHEVMRMKFLLVHPNGRMPFVRSTSDLNTAEFSEYVEQCRRFGAELGVAIPKSRNC